MIIIRYEKAANQGNAKAQCNLGCRYCLGEGIEKDLKQGFYW
jgi:TPR repeat protein